jgi:GT2 family glycosyltransferase
VLSKKLSVSVLVLNYCGKGYLRECLESLKNQTFSEYTVYVVDNGSTDNSVEYVHKYFPWVRIIAFRENLGFTKAYNEAIKMVDTNFVALLNNDTRVDRRWLQELMNAILEDELIAVTGSKILLYDNPDLVNHAGAKITPMGGGFDIGFFAKDGKQYNVKKYVGVVCGAAMLVRKQIWVKIGGFDDDYFSYFEDVDLCWRLWLNGYKVLYVPASIVYHKFGGSWGRISSPKRLYLGHLNKLRNMFKNLELSNLAKGIVISSGFDLMRSFNLLTMKDTSGIKAILKEKLFNRVGK